MLLLFFLSSTVFHLKCHTLASEMAGITLKSPGVSVKNPKVWDSEVEGTDD